MGEDIQRYIFLFSAKAGGKGSASCRGRYNLGERVAHDNYEVHLESKERFAIQRYLLIIGKKQNMQVLSHTFTYFST